MQSHFPDVRKMFNIGSDANREISDIAPTRYACYLIAPNGDGRKLEIAFAQPKRYDEKSWLQKFTPRRERVEKQSYN